MNKPGIAIMIAEKLKGKKSGMDEGDGEGKCEKKYVEMAQEVLDAIDSKDAEALAVALNSIHECWDAEHEGKDMADEGDEEEEKE
jgi:hypothetical protein